jgi:hypothetical protein
MMTFFFLTKRWRSRPQIFIDMVEYQCCYIKIKNKREEKKRRTRASKAEKNTSNKSFVSILNQSWYSRVVFCWRWRYDWHTPLNILLHLSRHSTIQNVICNLFLAADHQVVPHFLAQNRLFWNIMHVWNSQTNFIFTLGGMY